jgi:hypothetical protein
VVDGGTDVEGGSEIGGGVVAVAGSDEPGGVVAGAGSVVAVCPVVTVVATIVVGDSGGEVVVESSATRPAPPHAARAIARTTIDMIRMEGRDTSNRLFTIRLLSVTSRSCGHDVSAPSPFCNRFITL